MNKVMFGFAAALSAVSMLAVVTPAQAEGRVGVTIGYPGGYGIAGPSYVAPPVVVQPAPVYVGRDPHRYWRERQWREREWREREWRARHDHDHHDHHDGHRPDGHDGRGGAQDNWRR